jgi:Holliday junction resolvase RusA-like endonuclease
VARFWVAGLAVPWRAPVFGKGGLKTEEHVKRWKNTIALEAHRAGHGEAAGKVPYLAPVLLRLVFCRATKTKKRWGTPWPTRPDIDNLTKGCADSLTGNVFKKPAKGVPARLMPPSPVGRILADDNLVTDLDIRKRWWKTSGVLVEIVAVDPSLKDFTGDIAP